MEAWARPVCRSPGNPPRRRARFRTPWAGCRRSCRSMDRGRGFFAWSLIASQNSLAVQVCLAPRHVAGVVAVPVELEHKHRRARRLAGEMLDVGIRTAFEI